ncbi:hypothetical protein F5B19DRAFT_499173 [Rostrohypoxylon terebratum]|nr:hypothetical protein F5B19DRAFT_499173 [Rostrohypoxylon terebratum]
MADSTRGQDTSNPAHLNNLENLKRIAKRSLPNDLDLPEPKFRQVAGDVRLRTDRNVEAQPPPPPPAPPALFTARQRYNRRRRLNIGDGGDDESDSDGDNPRRSHGEGSASVIQRRPAKQLPPDSPTPTKTSSLNSMNLTPEEQDRINRRRMLEDDKVGNHEARWRHAAQTFRAFDSQAKYSKRVLLENIDKPVLNGYNAKRHSDRTVMQLQEKRMRDFLYEVLGHETATEKREGDIEFAKASCSKDGLMQDIIERIELDFILRWENEARLSLVSPEGLSLHDALTTALLLTIVGRCRANYRTTYLRSMPSVSVPFPDDYYGSLTMNYERAIFSLPQGQSKSLLLSSRKNGRLSSGYIEWHEDRGREVYSKPKPGGLQRTQFFCDDTKYRRGVMLVYAINDFAPSARHVPNQDLRRFGWFRDLTYDQQYCRYDLDNEFKAIFMDGKVLALAKEEGWIYADKTST